MSDSGNERSTSHQSADPLIHEVREIRRHLSDQFGNDVDRLADHLKEIEEANRERVIKAPKRAGEDRSEVA